MARHPSVSSTRSVGDPRAMHGGWLAAGAAGLALAGGAALLSFGFSVEGEEPRAERQIVNQTPQESRRTAEGRSETLDPRRAYGYLVRICRLGPRPSGSQGMERQQKLIVEHFEKFGAQVRLQAFDAPHPLTGAPVRMKNIIVSWHPDARERVLLACHYDTRPFPDQDVFNPRGVFVGANDGASGVALFMEMAHHMRDLEPTHGVDFVFFDGEELVYGDRGKYFLGSEHFAKTYRDAPPEHRYVYGVVADMVADRDLNIYKEKNSMRFAPRLTDSIWETAARLGVREFIPREKYEILDDHIPLNEIAGIPSTNLIDFDYPYWHTTQDEPSKCSGASLVKVARVLLEWLTEVPAPGERIEDRGGEDRG